MLGHFKDLKFWRATAVLVSAMVGVGIFGIPFAFAKAGFWVGTAWLGLLAILTVFYDLIFAELTLRTQGLHHLAGYANIYLGLGARRVAFFAMLLSGYGALLAYTIISGVFLHNVLSQYIAINPDLYSVIFAGVWSLLVFVRIRTIAAIDFFVMLALGIVVLLILIFGLPHLQTINLTTPTWEFWFLPYGIILFALSGSNAIPIQRQLLAGREKLLKPAIVTAVALVTILYFAFALTVVGVTGEITTPEAISGLFEILGPGIILLGSIFGILTISTSFLIMSTSLYETLHLDYKIRPVWAWLWVVGPPLLFFWSGLRNFIDVIGLVGAVAVGILTIISLAAYLKSRKFALREPEFALGVPRPVIWILMLFFLAGTVYSLLVR